VSLTFLEALVHERFAERDASVAPEVIQLQGASTASDIWSLGCTIVELTTGKPPYGDLLAMSAMFRIVEDEFPPIPSNSSFELECFLQVCFAKDPSQRPSAEDLCDHIWLKRNWDPAKDVRPQDSLPFLRRISSELRRRELELLDRSALASPLPILEGRRQERSSSPLSLSPDLAGSSPLLSPALLAVDFNKAAASSTAAAAAAQPRLSTIDSEADPDTSPRGGARGFSLPPEQALVSSRSHSFVKSTFSKGMFSLSRLTRFRRDAERRHLCSGRV
jgi:serine/threonine protein kinase